jgi:hypothetical protein
VDFTGDEELWYGHPDIVLIPEELPDFIPISFFEEVPNDVTEDEDMNILQRNGTEMCESEPESSHFDKRAAQILSQAITFSFYQGNVLRNRHIQSASSLIPSLVLTPAHYYIVMYDYINDILLTSSHQEFSLWDEEDEGRLNLSAVLQIWMLLNHMDFIPSLSPAAEEAFAGSANFHRILQNVHLFEKTQNIALKSSFRPPTNLRKATNQNSTDFDEVIKN